MSITLFKTLLAVAEHGSFAQAAKVRNVSQAAVGQQMKRLEEILDTKLFDRKGKVPQMNSRAFELVPRARALVQSYDDLVYEHHEMDALQGELSLGAVPSTIRSLVPQTIKSLVVQYPSLHVRVVPGLSSDLHEQVERGAVDAAILSEPLAIGTQLNWEPLAKEYLILLASADSTDSDPLQLLKTRPYIGHTRRAAVGRLAENWLNHHGLYLHASMEMESIESVTSMVAHNLGVSIVPNVCVPDVVFASLKRLPLPAPRHFRELGMLTRKDCPHRLLIEGLLKQLQITISKSGSDHGVV